MKRAICHYSFNRRWAAEKWTPDRLASEAAQLGIEGLDFHAGLLGSPATAASAILKAVARHGRTLAGLSLSNNFNQQEAEAFRKQIQTLREWLPVAAAVRAPVVRVFGAILKGPKTPAAVAGCRCRALDGLAEIVPDAEKYGLTLAVENHGGYPGTGEEHVELVRLIGSKALRATVDVGNYLIRGEEGHLGTKIAAPCAAYVHLKDYQKAASAATPWGYEVVPCTVGKGAVDCLRCLEALRDAGYDGFVALEYEGPDDERIGIPASVKFMNEVFAQARVEERK